MKRYDEGWLVAILEGEGCFNQRPDAAPGKRGRIVLVTTDEFVARRLETLVPGSTVSGPHKKPASTHGPRKSVWYWGLYKTALVKRLAAKVRPGLSPRRQQQLDTMLS